MCSKLVGRTIAMAAALATAGAISCGSAPGAPPPAAAAPAEIAPLSAGDPFPPDVYDNLNPRGPGRIDLAAVLGTRPVLLYYWVAGNERSEEVFIELERLAGELGDGLTLYGVAVPRPGVADAATIGARLRDLGLASPVLADTGFVIGKRLQVHQVPDISILDREGRLRLTNGASLAQSLTPELDLAAVIRNTALEGSLPTYGALGHYFPVKELEGQPCPDFRAPVIADSVEQRWHSLIDADKLNVLIFWSVDCPHCRAALPEINAWLRTHPEGVNVVSAAKVTDDRDRDRTREFCSVNGFVFPTLVDGGEISSLYRVTSTPTILIIRPDGVIDSAIVSSRASFGETIERKKRELLQAS